YPSLSTAFQADLEISSVQDVLTKQKFAVETTEQNHKAVHATDVLTFAYILDLRSHAAIYMARWRFADDQWLWVKCSRKGDKSKNILQKEMKIWSHIEGRPFFLKLITAFQTDSGYYLVTPYEGRCTLNYINKVQGSLNANNVMFYVLELIHALIYLHEHDVIVRNINTNSVMVDHQGHVLLQDFSLGEFGASSRMKDFDTVPVFYLAPEIIKYDTYSKAIDWWALGITIYSLMYGQQVPGSVNQHVPGSVNKHVPGSVNKHVPGSVNQNVPGPVNQAVPVSLYQAVPCLVNQAVPCPVNQAVPCPVNQAVPCPVNQAVPCPVNQAVPCHVNQAVPGSVNQAVPCPVNQAVPCPVNQAAPCPVNQAVPCPVNQAVPCPVNQAVPCPVNQAVPCHVNQAVPGSVNQAAPCPVNQAVPCPVNQAVPCPVNQAVPCPVNQACTLSCQSGCTWSNKAAPCPVNQACTLSCQSGCTWSNKAAPCPVNQACTWSYQAAPCPVNQALPGPVNQAVPGPIRLYLVLSGCTWSCQSGCTWSYQAVPGPIRLNLVISGCTWSYQAVPDPIRLYLEPFRDSNTFKTISCILTKEPEYPQKLNGTKLIALCKDLLIKRQEHRLGSGALGSLFVINHPCLVDVDWTKLSARKFRPPFLPPENVQLKQKPKDADNLTLSTSKSSLSEFQWSGDQELAQEKTALNYLPFGLSTSFPKQEIGARRWCSSSNLSQFVNVSSRNIHRQTFIHDTIKELEAIRSQNSNLDKMQRRGKASEWHSHDVSVFRNTNLNHGPLDEPSEVDGQSWFWMGAMLHGKMNAGLKGQSCEQALGVGEGVAAEGGDRAAPTEAELECLSCTADESHDLNRSSTARCRNENGLREAESGQCDGSIACDCVFHILFEWTPSDKMSDRVVYSRNCTSHAAVNDLSTGSSRAAVNDLSTGFSRAAVNDLNTGSSHAAVNDLNTGSSHAAVKDLNTGSSHAALNDLNTGSSHAVVNDLNTGSSHTAVDDTDTSHAAFADQNNSGLVQDSDNEVTAKENDQVQCDSVSLLDSTRKRGNINLENTSADKEMLLAKSKLSFFITDSSVSFDEEKCESGIDPLRQHNDDHRYQHIDTKLIKSLDQRKLFESKEVKDPCLRKDDALKSETSETMANQSCVITDQYNFTHTDCSGELMCAFNPLTPKTCQDVNTSDSPKSTFLDYVTRRLKDDPTCASPSNGHTKQSTNTSDCHHRETQIQQCRASNPTEYSSDSAAERGRIACGEDTFVSGFPAKLSLNEDHFKDYDKSFKNALFGGSNHNESSHSGRKTHFLKRLIFGKRSQKDHSCIHRKTSCQAGTHRETSCQACTHSETSFESETLEKFLTKSKPKKKFGFLSIRPRAESVRGTCDRKNNKTLTQPSKNECTDADYYQMNREKECIENILGTTSRSTCNLPEELLQHLPNAENVKVDYCEDLKLTPIFSDNQRSIISDSNIPRSIISDSDCFHKNEKLICTGGLPFNHLELELQMELDQTLQKVHNTDTNGLGKGNDQKILDTNKVDITLENVDTQEQTIVDKMRINGQTIFEKEELSGQTILEKEDLKEQMLLDNADINRQTHRDSVDNNGELLFDKQNTNELILLNCELKELSSDGVESVHEARETQKKAADEVNSFGCNEWKTESDVSEDNNDSSHDKHDLGCKNVMNQSECQDVMSQSDCKDVISQSDRKDVISQSDRKDIMTRSDCKDVMSQSGCFDVMRQLDCKDVMIKPYCKDIRSQSDCNKGDNEQGQCGTRQCEDQSTLNQDEDKSHSDCRDEQSQTKWKEKNTDSQEGMSQCADKQSERSCEEKTNEWEVRLLDNVDVDKADLDNVDLDNVDLDNVDLDNVDLDNANLDNVDLDNVDLDNANLDNIDLDNVDLDKADLDNVDLDNVDLDNVDLDNFDLDNVDLNNVDLDNVDLDNVDLDNVDLDNVDLDNVDVDNVGQTKKVETQIVRHLDKMDDSVASLISGSTSFETAALTFNVSPDSTSGSPAFVTADATFDSEDDLDLKEICTSHSTINPNSNFITYYRSTSSNEGTSESDTGRVLPLGYEKNESLGSVQSEADTLNPLFVMTSDNGENGTGKYGTGSDLLILVDGKPGEVTSKHGQDARLTSLKQGNDAYDRPNSGEINLMADDMKCPQSLIGTNALTSGVTEKHLFSTNNEAHQNETNGDKSMFSSPLDKSGGRVGEMTLLKTETGNPRDAADDGLSVLWRSTPHIAQPSVDASMTALSRARQMMRELDEITPYSESDFWRRGERRQSRFGRDAPDFFSGGFYGDSMSQDHQGHSDHDIQVIGTLTIEYLTPPIILAERQVSTIYKVNISSTVDMLRYLLCCIPGQKQNTVKCVRDVSVISPPVASTQAEQKHVFDENSVENNMFPWLTEKFLSRTRFRAFTKEGDGDLCRAKSIYKFLAAFKSTEISQIYFAIMKEVNKYCNVKVYKFRGKEEHLLAVKEAMVLDFVRDCPFVVHLIENFKTM
ncbi:tetra-peptide repeat homeobox protein 1, partial [Biomphalaria pfeifferi]